MAKSGTNISMLKRPPCPPPAPAACAFAVFMNKSIGLLPLFAADATTQSRAVYSSAAPNLTRARRVLQGMEFRGIGVESGLLDRTADLPHQPLIEMQIVDG